MTSFTTPTPIESAHDFLWRVHREVPPQGCIGIFNRSHYEDVLITHVHGMISGRRVEEQVDRINAFEELLRRSGTTEKDGQRERLEERVNDPEKRWKFDVGDLEEQRYWDEYMEAFEDMLTATSTDYGPWHGVPTNRKWYRNLVVADIVVSTLEDMKLTCPPAPADVDFEHLPIVSSFSEGSAPGSRDRSRNGLQHEAAKPCRALGSTPLTLSSERST